MRALSPLENANLRFLANMGLDYALLEPTKTGLGKSILDATFTVRSYLERNGLHSYQEQAQGQGHKVQFPAFLVSRKGMRKSVASLYRPTTKKGDPRIWFSGLTEFSSPNDIIAILASQKTFFAFNMTKNDLHRQPAVPIIDALSELARKAASISLELLRKIRCIAQRGFVKSVMGEGKKDTAIGRTLEHELGIGMNSSKKPDYKGIEIKSFRSPKKNTKGRVALFSQVANWEASALKSSHEILNEFGRDAGHGLRLYCTVDVKSYNSFGLRLKLDGMKEILFETSLRRPDFAAWMMSDLHNRLLEKHNETFWVKANCKHMGSVEHFEFTEIMHTRKPVIARFDLMLEKSLITLDHMIKLNVRGKALEKGPSFKIDIAYLPDLFPEPRIYPLLGPKGGRASPGKSSECPAM